MRTLATAVLLMSTSASASLLWSCTKSEDDDADNEDSRGNGGAYYSNVSKANSTTSTTLSTAKGGANGLTSAAPAAVQSTVDCVGGTNPQENAFCPRDAVCKLNSSCTCVCDPAGCAYCRVTCGGTTTSNSNFNLGGSLNFFGSGGSRFGGLGGATGRLGTGGNRFGVGGANPIAVPSTGGMSQIVPLATGGRGMGRGGTEQVAQGGSTRGNRSRGGASAVASGGASNPPTGGASAATTTALVACPATPHRSDPCGAVTGECPGAPGCFCNNGVVEGSGCPAVPSSTTPPPSSSAGAGG